MFDLLLQVLNKTLTLRVLYLDELESLCTAANLENLMTPINFPSALTRKKLMN